MSSAGYLENSNLLFFMSFFWLLVDCVIKQNEMVPPERVYSTGFWRFFWIFLKNEHGKLKFLPNRAV